MIASGREDGVPLRGYRPLRGMDAAPQGMDYGQTAEVADERWDAFLSSHALGQFQQSSRWAEGKCDGRWEVRRFVAHRGGEIAGGFQMLIRPTRFGRIAYISKGPVPWSDEEPAWQSLLNAALGLAREERLRALVIQPPDGGLHAVPRLEGLGFTLESLLEVIDASLWFDLAGGPEEIMRRIPGYNRTFIRQAQRKGVVLREGGEADIPLFFELMRQTCIRQRVAPNPGSEADVRRIWRAFQSGGRFRMAFAEHEGKVLATLTAIRFGDRVSLWKKGWTSESSDLRPNHLLYYDALCWAQREGAKICDFYSLRRDIAEALLAGRPLTEAQSRSRDRFHLGFGGRPVLLPPAYIHFQSPVLRIAYRLARWARSKVGSRLGSGSGG